jgi:4-hydroxybenzoate polyprenyltransferase
MISKLKKLTLISRPVSWLNTAYPFGAGYLVSGGSFDAVFFMGTLYFLIPYNLLMYGINDIFDYESDIRNPRKGGMEGAKEQKAFHPIIWSTIAITNTPFVVWLLVNGSGAANAVLAAVLFFVIAYSIKYLRFKEIPVLDSITSSLHFTGPLIFALVITDNLSASLPFVLAFFLWGMASHAFGAIQDIKPDRDAGLVSIATVFGAQPTAIITLVLYLISAWIVIMQGYPATLVGITGVLYAVNVAPFLQVTDHNSEVTNKGWRRFIWLNYCVGFVLTLILIGLFIN